MDPVLCLVKNCLGVQRGKSGESFWIQLFAPGVDEELKPWLYSGSQELVPEVDVSAPASAPSFRKLRNLEVFGVSEHMIFRCVCNNVRFDCGTFWDFGGAQYVVLSWDLKKVKRSWKCDVSLFNTICENFATIDMREFRKSATLAASKCLSLIEVMHLRLKMLSTEVSIDLTSPTNELKARGSPRGCRSKKNEDATLSDCDSVITLTPVKRLSGKRKEGHISKAATICAPSHKVDENAFQTPGKKEAKTDSPE